jgi:hypothetical protein
MPRRLWSGDGAALVGVNRSPSPLHRHALLGLVLTALASALVSCGGDPRLALPASPSPTPQSAALASPTAAATPSTRKPTIGEVTWTTGVDSVTREPSDAVTHYLTDAPLLVAVAKATALPVGSIVEATWTYNNTPLEAFATQLAVDESIDSRWLSFSLSRDPNTPWPAGLYEIALSLDGKTVQESSVEVVDAQ